MNICLVAHIPNDFISRTIEHTVQGQRQFYNSQIRCQMTAVFRNRMDKKPAYFFSDFFNLAKRIFFQILWCMYSVQQAIQPEYPAFGPHYWGNK